MGRGRAHLLSIARRFDRLAFPLPRDTTRVAMPARIRDAGLPLRYVTPPRWAEAVLAQRLELLNDHAHLEKKAATNALELLTRWPEPNPPENWVAAMTAVSRDEV